VDPVRTETNIRLYSDEDLKRVQCIRYLTQVRGVNLAGVKMLLRLRAIDELLEEIEAWVEEQEQRRDRGERAAQRATAGRAPGSERTADR